jgi:hypothetical protein
VALASAPAPPATPRPNFDSHQGSQFYTPRTGLTPPGRPMFGHQAPPVFGHEFLNQQAAYEQGRTLFNPTFGFHRHTPLPTVNPWWQQPVVPPFGPPRMPPPQGQSTQGPTWRPWASIQGPPDTAPPAPMVSPPVEPPGTEPGFPPSNFHARSETGHVGSSHFYVDPQERFASHNDST